MNTTLRVYERPKAVASLLTAHWPMVLLCLFALFPLFADLGGDLLWSDEGDTAVLASNIRKFGVPVAWDGTTFIDSDRGSRENDDLVMISHPWVQYYVTAAAFALFGESTFAARLPFAFAGLLTLITAYVLLLRLIGDRRAGLSAGLLLLLSVQFLLYARQCRNYALAMFLTCLLLLAFLGLRDGKSALWFAFVSVLLFHTHPAAVAPLVALGLLTLVYRPLQDRRKWFWLAAPAIALLTLPWLVLVRAGYAVNTAAPQSAADLVSRAAQFFIECASVTPVPGVLIMILFVWWRRLRERRLRAPAPPARPAKNKRRLLAQAREKMESLFNDGERLVIVLVGALLAAYGALMVLSQPTAGIWSLGLRQVAAIIPLVAVLTGMLVAKASRSSLKVWLVLMLLLGGTKLGRLTPWPVLRADKPYFDRSKFAATHKPHDWTDGLLRTGLIGFYRDLWRENPGTVSEVCRFVRTHTEPDDVLITNYDWEPLYFHTRRPLGLTIFPEYKVLKAARRHALPEYVFSVERARWLIWRAVWDGYQGYDRDRVYQMLVSRGATLECVASVPETFWENRENVHFRRFPGNDHKFVWYTNAPPTQIFRIHWPKERREKKAAARRDRTAPVD